MRCCNKELITIFKKDTIRYYEDKIILEDDNIFASYVELDENGEIFAWYDTITRIKGDREAYLFCKKCNVAYYYYYGQKHCDTEEYTESMYEITIENLIKFLSNDLLVNPELINFEGVKELCNSLGVSIESFIKKIALNITSKI